jgi:hypothetical protein
MSYTTVDHFVTTYPRMSATNATSASLFAWLDRAHNHINAVIKDAVGTVPVSPSPPLLRDIEEDLAYVMFLRRSVGDTKDKSVQTMWDDVNNRLEGIRNGTMILVNSAGSEISVTARNEVPWSSTDGYAPTFGMSDIENAEVDPDRVDDEEAIR